MDTQAPESGGEPAPPPLELPATFRTSLVLRVFLIVSASAAFAIFIYLSIIRPSLSETPSTVSATVATAIVSLGFVALFATGAYALHRQRLVITHDSLEMREFFKVRRLSLSEIKGFRPFPQQSSYWIYPKDGGKPFRPGYVARRAELEVWLTDNLVDLDQREAEGDEKAILADESLGLSEDDRRVSLARARATCRVLNGFGYVLTLMGIFYPRPYPHLMAALVAMPVLALGTWYALRGVVRLDAPKHSGYPTVAVALLLPPLALFLRAFLDFNILDWGRAALLAGPFVLVGAGIVLGYWRKLPRPALSALGMILFTTCYGFGLTLQANCLLDRAEATRYAVAVQEKHTKGSESTEYYFTVSAWSDYGDGEEVQVTRAQYERAEEGSQATVLVMPGALGIRWYVVSVEPQVPE